MIKIMTISVRYAFVCYINHMSVIMDVIQELYVFIVSIMINRMSQNAHFASKLDLKRLVKNGGILYWDKRSNAYKKNAIYKE